MIQAVFFDFNGVIIDDEPLQMKAYQEVLGREGLTLTEADYYWSLGMDDVTFVRAAFGRVSRELADDVMRRVIENESTKHRALIERELPLFPGVVTAATARRLRPRPQAGRGPARRHLRTPTRVVQGEPARLRPPAEEGGQEPAPSAQPLGPQVPASRL